MKRRVRIYKKQLGGVQAIQEQQQVQQNSQQQDEMIQASILGMLEEGSLPEDVLDSLMQAGIEQEKATYLLNGAIEYMNDQEKLKKAENEDDTETYDDLQAEQQILTDQADEDRQDQILAQMYESDNYDDGSDEEDQFVQDYIIDNPQQEQEVQRTGGVPNKRKFVRQATRAIKAQMGQEMAPPAKADSTDTGARQMMMASFLKSVQDTGNNALIKQDAEQAYNMSSQYPMSEPNTPEAQLGLNMRPGQQRRFNRRLNRAIGNIPIPMQGMMPAGFVTYPMLQGLQQYMPAEGSYYGGPQLANIDVRKTGLFGRPKEYTITFAQQALYDPTLRRDVIKQEARNQGVLTEDEVDELLKKEEAITGNKSETPKAEEQREASGKKDISGSSASSASNSSSNRKGSTPAAATVETELPEQVDEVQKGTVQQILDRYHEAQKYVKPAKSKYAGLAKDTEGDFLYLWDPQNSAYLYGLNKETGKYSYKPSGSNSTSSWTEINDPNKTEQLDERLKGAELYTLESKPGYLYRYRADGSYEKLNLGTGKTVAIIKKGDPGYDYLNKNKQWETYIGEKQVGGMVDSSNPDLYKFVYGGNDDIPALPPAGGKLTDSPYFEEGGYLPKADNGVIVKAYKNGKFVGYMHQDVADKHGLDWNRADDYDSKTDYDIATDDRYNTYAPQVFPGGYAKQKGLPYNPMTGEAYYGQFSPYGQVDKIDVTKTRLSGAPKRYTMYYTDYFPIDGSSTSPLETQTKTQTENNFTQPTEYKRSFGERLRDVGYKLMPKDKDIIRQPRLRNEINQARSEKLGVPFLEPQAYGGDINYAQTGLNYPYALDPRFYPDLPSEQEQEAFINAAGNLDTTKSDMGPIDFTDVLGMKNYVRSQVNKEGIDPTTFGTEEELKPILADPKQYAIDMKTKKTNEQLRRGLDMFNVGAYGITGMLGERGQRDKMRQMYDRLKSDALYGSTGLYDRGTYEANSGLFRPDQMGFTGVVKEGGSIYKEGGTHYMSPAQVKKFLEEGGELEFV